CVGVCVCGCVRGLLCVMVCESCINGDMPLTFTIFYSVLSQHLCLNTHTHTSSWAHTHTDPHIWQMQALWSEILPPSLLQGGHWFTAMTDVSHSIIITSPPPAPDRVNAHTHTHTHTHRHTHTHTQQLRTLTD